MIEPKGFGKVSVQRILEAIQARHSASPFLLLPAARRLGSALASYLRSAAEVLQVEVCGPARRWEEVVDSLAFAVTSSDPPAVRARLSRHPLVAAESTEEEGGLHDRLTNGVPFRLHFARPEGFGLSIDPRDGEQLRDSLSDRDPGNGFDAPRVLVLENPGPGDAERSVLALTQDADCTTPRLVPPWTVIDASTGRSSRRSRSLTRSWRSSTKGGRS